MVVRILVAALIFLGTLASTSARADWVVAGAQTACDSKAGRFEIRPWDRTSEGTPPVAEGFQVAADGTSRLHCSLGKRKLLAAIKVISPQPRGACMGIGAVSIISLSVDGVELLKEGFPLDWDCWNSSEPPIVDVRIEETAARVDLTLCDGSYEAYVQKRTIGNCETESFDTDRLAAEYAKIDRDLADPATQSVQSATRIPTKYDLANVFAKQTDPNGAPICTHWRPTFVRMRGEIQAWGRIAGRADERTPIHRVNPQICTRKSDQACASSAYVIAGDRVDVGFVCGPWTMIRYHPRVLAFADTVGWVETKRVYGIQVLPKPLWNSKPLDNDPLWKQPLFAAVLHDDPNDIADLVKNGADPNGADKSGRTPLAIGLYWNKRTAIEALLNAGASADSSVSDTGRPGVTALMDAASVDRLGNYKRILEPTGIADPIALCKLLLQHGAKLEATDAEGGTALFHAVEANNVDVAAFLLDAGANVDAARGVHESGAQTTDGQYGGYTPLMAALRSYERSRDPSMIRLLLARGADPDFMADKDDFDPEQPMYVGKTLLAIPDLTSDSDLEDPGYAGETVLTVAARRGYKTVVSDLLARAADPSLARADGASPEDIANKAGFPEVANLIARATKQAKPAQGQ